MRPASAFLAALRRPAVAVGVAVAVVVTAVWAFTFFLPQGSKLSKLQAQEQSLQAQVDAGNARVALLKKESQHTKQIQAMLQDLQGYVPATEQIYTYIDILSGAAAAAGVTITAITPSHLTALSGSSYSALPIGLSAKGTYDEILAFIKGIYNLPRLTDIDSLSLSGGGRGSTRTSSLSVALSLVVFTTQKPTGSS